ncbi:MAG: alpha/beta hydrolase [Alphaproteobacteria bacterium]|nr:MAG: alpha/beta hydrolase [Alphaproteobacteria bacterium]
MRFHDDDLQRFDASGAQPFPAGARAGRVENDGASIWYAECGAGPAVILLHGGLGNAGNWGYQIAPLVDAGFRVILIDSRGHGRSTRDDRPYSYHLMSTDVSAVMDGLAITRAAIIGWSDGACTGMILGHHQPDRVAGILFFACNVDPSGTLPFEMTPLIERCFSRHKQDYAALSPTPEKFEEFVEAVGLMQRTQPDYSAEQLREIRVPMTVMQSEGDEFIRREHAEYLARTVPGAELVVLPGVTHFAPVQRPDVFNAAMLQFLGRLPSWD